jgi:hypothetical protein
MPTKLKAGKGVVREVEVFLAATGFRHGLVCKLAAEGVYLKPPKGRWSKAYFVSWGDMVHSGALRRAAEIKKERAERRAAKRAAKKLFSL